MRAAHEASLHQKNTFITLTYAPEHLPTYSSLRKKDLQKFFKRLRSPTCPGGGREFRYLACGEYGPRTLRPHYHACLFGTDFADAVPVGDSRERKPLYTSKSLEDVWQKGHVTVAPFTWETARYVAHYTIKKQLDDVDDASYDYVDGRTGEVTELERPFLLMSRKPGLGAGWLEKHRDDVYPRGHVVLDGCKYALPRYYKDRLAEQEQEYLRLKAHLYWQEEKLEQPKLELLDEIQRAREARRSWKRRESV